MSIENHEKRGINSNIGAKYEPSTV